MPLSEWVVNRTSTRLNFGLDVSDPLINEGSLFLTNEDPYVTTGAIQVTPGVTLNHGFTRAKIRTIIRLDAIGNDSIADEGIAGILAMTSAEDVTVPGSTCYAAGIRFGSVQHSFVLIKYKEGIGQSPDDSIGIILDIGLTTFSGAGVVRTLEFEWDADFLTKTRLTLRQGVQLDFSDLTDEIVFEDTSAPYVTTVTEGLFLSDFEGPGNSKIVTFDRTRHFRVT